MSIHLYRIVLLNSEKLPAVLKTNSHVRKHIYSFAVMCEMELLDV